MIIYFFLLCNIFFGPITCMETEKESTASSINKIIEDHYNGILVNHADVYKDLPVLIEQASTSKKALLSLIGHFVTLQYTFDFFAYQTPHNNALLRTIPWQLISSEKLDQEIPETSNEKFYYGLLYYCSFFKKYRNPKKNSKKHGLSLLEESAHEGFAKAMHYLGCIARLKKDKDTAMLWHCKAAALSFAPSTFEIAHMILKKNKTDQNHVAEALEYIDKAAKANYATAHFYLGLIYDDKTNLKILADYDKAHYHYLQAAKLGCLQARHNLGLLYLTQKNNDIIEGLKHINKAVQQGYSHSQTYLGMLYCSGLFINKNPIKGIELLSKAAEQNDSAAFYHLATLYLLGENTPQNVELGIKYLKKSSTDNIFAQFQLAIFYLNGIHVEQNINKAISLLTKSAVKGYYKAQYELGKLYTEGTIIEKNSTRGKKLLQSAAAQGYQNAISYLEKI